MLLLHTARKRWKIRKGDVTAAFLQGKPSEEKRETYVDAPVEVKEALNMKGGDRLQLLVAAYGTVHAPRQWWKTVEEDFGKLGLTAMTAEPCLWCAYERGRLVGMILVHVDDFLIAGDERSATWQKIVREVKQLYTWGEWQEDDEAIQPWG